MVVLRALTIAIALVFIGHFGSARAGTDSAPAVQEGDNERPALSETEDAAEPDLNNLMGLQIYDANGEEVGEITAILMTQGELKAIAVNIGDVLGLGRRAVVVPASELDVDLATDRIVTPELTRQQYEKLPDYEP